MSFFMLKMFPFSLALFSRCGNDHDADGHGQTRA